MYSDAEKNERSIELCFVKARETLLQKANNYELEEESHFIVEKDGESETAVTRRELKKMFDTAAMNAPTMVADKIVETVKL